VGPRTYETGFKDAKIYVKDEIVDGVGGGICQVTSTLYMTTLMADLKTVERKNHRFTVAYIPLGMTPRGLRRH
jgi:vancomycin resistance protein YoaR